MPVPTLNSLGASSLPAEQLPQRVVIVDDTCHTRSMRAPFLKIARQAGWARVLLHVRADVYTCLERNVSREGAAKVPVGVV